MKTIPITKIKSLRLTCNHCRAALILPLDVREVPGRCFNCEQNFPADNLKKLLLELRHTQKELNQHPRKHDIAIEVMLEDD